MSNGNTRNLGISQTAFLYGLIAITIQVVMARLAVSFAGGNELYLTAYFAIWLIATAAGSLFSKIKSIKFLFGLLAIFALTGAYFLLIAPMLLYTRPGLIIGPGLYLAATAVSLIPVCFVNGGLFRAISVKSKVINKPGHTYGSEALGALVGGILTTAYYIAGGRDFVLLMAVVVLCLIPSMKRYSAKAVIAVIAILITITQTGAAFENRLIRTRYMPFNYIDSVSGKTVRYDLVENIGALTLYSGGVKAADYPDFETPRELLYWSLTAVPNAKRIGFVNAAYFDFGYLIPDSVDCEFINEDMQWLSLIPDSMRNSKKFIEDDPVAFLAETEKLYDAIVINTGTIISLADSRFESADFLASCKNRLKEDGVLLIKADAYSGVWREELRNRLSRLYHRFQALFYYVTVIPGEKLILIGSDLPPLSGDHLRRNYISLGLDDDYFNMSYIESRLNQYNHDRTLARLAESPPKSGYFSISDGLQYYFAQRGTVIDLPYNQSIKFAAPLVLLAFFAFFALRSSPETRVPSANLFYFGTVSFALELIVIYSYQLSGAYLYAMLGIIAGLFMAGSAIGSLGQIYLNRRSNLPKVDIRTINVSLGLILIAGSLLVFFRENLGILYLVVLIAGIAGGAAFSAVSTVFGGKTGVPYAIDLTGAVFGALGAFGLLISMWTEFELLIILIAMTTAIFATNLRYVSKYKV